MGFGLPGSIPRLTSSKHFSGQLAPEHSVCVPPQVTLHCMSHRFLPCPSVQYYTYYSNTFLLAVSQSRRYLEECRKRVNGSIPAKISHSDRNPDTVCCHSWNCDSPTDTLFYFLSNHFRLFCLQFLSRPILGPYNLQGIRGAGVFLKTLKTSPVITAFRLFANRV